ncbi:MAG: hypothetical protein KAT34_11635 [Candidatus Aminicenantes bacterium]|nr:hypothetical protein [Candidatus Aminicenantes bacterium]
MKKIILLLLIFIFFVLSPAALKAVSVQTALIPENTQWLLHFDMEKFTSTRLYSLLLAGHSGNMSKVIGTKILEKFGIDPAKDITGITIFGTAKDKDKAVVSLTGNLHKDTLLSLVKEIKDHKKARHGKYTVYRWDRNQVGAFANDHMLLIGKDESAVKDALDVIAGKKKNIKKTKMMSYLKEMPKNAFLQMAVDNIASIAGAKQPLILQKTGMVFFVALEKNENLTLKLKMATDTVETAKNIEQIVRGFTALAKMQLNGKEGKEHIRKVLETLAISIKGNIVELGLSYPSEALVSILGGSKKGFNFKF